MNEIVTWTKNNTSTIYQWIGRITVAGILLIASYFIIQGLIGLNGVGFDPVLYILIGLVIYIIHKNNELNRSYLTQINAKLDVLNENLAERPKVSKKTANTTRRVTAKVRSSKRK